MNLSELLSAASAATELLAEYPIRWLGVVLIFLVVVESLMFIPYVGFTVKLAVAGVVSGQIISMFAAAATGTAPSPVDLGSAFNLPFGALWVLAVGALPPFAAGMLFLYIKSGSNSVKFFFSNILKMKSPPEDLFVASKYVMQLVALPFTFLTGAVVLKGLTGIAAFTAAFSAVPVNWLPVLSLGLLALAFEWASVQLSSLRPKWVAATIGGVLLVAFLGWSFAVMYTTSAKVFGVASASGAR
jgi:hypothetical protein